jgi:hypothetical protein
MLYEAFSKKFEVAVVLTNDSDLLMPIQVVRQEGYAVGLLSPVQYTSMVLAGAATFIKKVRPGVLAASQFPAQLVDANGTFNKPPAWA